MDQHGLQQFVEKPEAFLRDVIQGLADSDMSALAAIFVRGGELQTPVQLSDAELRLVERIGGTRGSILKGLHALDGSLVRRNVLGNDSWVFKHPTIRDAFASIIAENPELVDLYIAGVATSRLLNEVSCGVINLKGVKLVVPKARFDSVVQRLNEHVTAAAPQEVPFRDSERAQFIATRCSREFLELYIALTPDCWEQWLDFPDTSSWRFSVIVALHDFGLLEEDYRTRAIERVSKNVTSNLDTDFLRVDRTRRFFSREEIRAIMLAVAEEVLPQLPEIVESRLDSYTGNEDPDRYVGPLRESLEALSEYFEESDLKAGLRQAINEIDFFVDEHTDRRDPDEIDYDFHRDMIDDESSSGDGSERRIFDDLDA